MVTSGRGDRMATRGRREERRQDVDEGEERRREEIGWQGEENLIPIDKDILFHCRTHT